MATAKQILNRLIAVAVELLTENRIATLSGEHTAGKAHGVVEMTTPIGRAAALIVQGVTHVESGAAFSAGAMITSDADGKAVAVDPAALAMGATIEILGTAMDAATGADQLVRVFVNPFIFGGSKDDAITLVAAETITAGQIVDAEGKHTVNKGVGVAVNGGNAAANIVVKIKGTTLVKSGAAFAIGDKLASDANGKAVKYDPANTNIGTVVDIIGTALAAATGADENVSVLLNPAVGVGVKAAG